MNNIKILLILLYLAFISGCALYGSEGQYERGNFYFVTGSGEVARIKQDKLAFEKLKASPVQTAYIDNTGNIIESIPAGSSSEIPVGFKGIISNLDNSSRINVHINGGVEKKRYFLGPGQHEIDYLVPGNYRAICYRKGYKVGEWSFNVGVAQYSYFGKKYHWFLTYEN